jgi:hypothetical protein
MNRIKGLIILLVFALILPAFAYSQDTTRLGNFLSKRANPDERGLTAIQAIDSVGKEVYIRDTVFNQTTFNKNYRVFYVGNRDTSKALHVIIKNTKIQVEELKWLMHPGAFSGKCVLHKGKPSIIITNEGQLATRIEL